VSVW